MCVVAKPPPSHIRAHTRIYIDAHVCEHMYIYVAHIRSTHIRSTHTKAGGELVRCCQAPPLMCVCMCVTYIRP